MKREEIYNQIKKKKSFLCVGLDPDFSKIPEHIKKSDDPLFEFNRLIIEATHDLCVAFKANTAFYECLGSKGWESFEKTVRYIKNKFPEIFLIADAKRGDIGNTSSMYANAFFKNLPCDAITVAPYMGEDSVKPFLEYPDKWAIVLALTSNKGAGDFQLIENSKGRKLFEEVLIRSSAWGNTDNMMYVTGATQAGKLQDIRKIIPDHFLLVPGVGVQGGSLKEVAEYGMNNMCGLLVNASRSILYASSGEDFKEKARGEALKIQEKMKILLDKR